MFFIHGYKRRNAVVLIIRGELNFESTPKLKQAIERLIQYGVLNIIIDLGSITFIDSSGIGTLLAAKHILNTASGDIKLININPDIQKVFRLTEVDRVIEIYETLEEAEGKFEEQIELSAEATELLASQNKPKGEMISIQPTKFFNTLDKLLVFNLSTNCTTNNISHIKAVKNNYLVIDNPTYNGEPIEVGKIHSIM